MYSYSEFDEAFLAERNAQFRAQVERRIDGSLTEDEFKPLRLMNGLYLQLHAYMLRVAIPYGTLNSPPDAPARHDRAAVGQGLWPFHDPPEHPVQLAASCAMCRICSMLWAEVGMHAIQTSGNTIRNVTADHFAGAPPRTRSPIRAPWQSSSGNGRPTIPNSSSWAASSRSASPAARMTARSRRPMISASASSNATARSATRSLSVAGLAARP